MLDENDGATHEPRKSNFLSLKDKAEILERLENGATASHLAQEYGISKSTVSRFKKRKESIQEAVTTIYPNNTDRRTIRRQFHPKMEFALYQWYTEQREQNIVVTGNMIREKAQYYYLQFQESNYSFSASSGWIKNFKKRFGIRLVNDLSPEQRAKNEKNRKNKKTTTTTTVVKSGLHGDIRDDQQNNCDYNSRGQNDNSKQVVMSNCIKSSTVDDKEAFRCLETVIKWSMEKSIDSLYLTMLRSLKARARDGSKK